MEYSVIKINANLLALNSVLNPETSSLSPSAKSKGVRLVSANRIISHINISLGKICKARFRDFESNCLKEIKNNPKIMLIITKINLISYEMVWAMPRILPIMVYLFFALHPVNIKG